MHGNITLSTNPHPISFANGLAWYVIRTELKAEQKAHEAVKSLGFESFLPLERVKKTKRGRRIEIEQPLFIRYFFVRFDIEKPAWTEIRDTDGVEDILSHLRVPVRVPESEIDRLRLAEDMGFFDFTKPPEFAEGKSVMVDDDHPLAGWVGKIVKARSGERVEILMKMFGAERTFDIPLSKLKPLE